MHIKNNGYFRLYYTQNPLKLKDKNKTLSIRIINTYIHIDSLLYTIQTMQIVDNFFVLIQRTCLIKAQENSTTLLFTHISYCYKVTYKQPYKNKYRINNIRVRPIRTRRNKGWLYDSSSVRLIQRDHHLLTLLFH